MAEGSSSAPRSSKSSKPKNFAWSWAAAGSTKEIAICIFCGKPCRGGGITRLKHHLSGISGGGIEPCPKVPTEVRQRCIAWREGLKESQATKVKSKDVTFENYKRGATQNVQVLFDGSSGASHSIPSESGGGGDAIEENQEIQGRRQQAFGQHFNNVSGDSIFETFTTPGAQPTLAGMGPWTRDLHDGARNVIADWFFSCAIPHNAAAHPLYQKGFDAAIAAGKGFRAPTPKQLAGSQLDRCVEDIDALVRSHRAYWSLYGCTLMADGWTTSRGRTLINFLVSSYKGLLFLRSVDASHKVKRADYLADLFEEVIQEVGPSHVVQVITDNAANFVKAGDLIMGRHPTIYWTPCAAHCLDLLLEDIGKLPRFAEVIKKAKTIGKFIYNHTIVLDLVRTHTKGKDLVRPGATRFATHFLTLQSMESLRLPLMQAFGSDQWQSSDDFQNYRTLADGMTTTDLVYDMGFWGKVSEAVKVVEPLIHVLRIVDGDSSPMPKLYEAMDVAKEAIASFYERDEMRYREIWRMIDERWDGNLHRPLHAAAHHLNPRFVYAKEDEPYVPDNEVKIGFYDTMERLVPDLDAQEVLITQLRKFVRAEGIMFSKPLARRQSQRMTAARWWEEFGADTPELSAFAMRILTQPCSASGCERNWSAFEHIYAKRRTRLTMARLDRLVYCYYNMKLRFRTEDPMGKEDMQLDTLMAMVDDETRIAGVLEWLSTDDDPQTVTSAPDMSMADSRRYTFTTAEGVTLDMSIDDADAISRAVAEDDRVQMLSRLRKRTRGDGSGPSNI